MARGEKGHSGRLITELAMDTLYTVDVATGRENIH